MESAPPDVAIVGAGLIGMSIAWRLSQAGARVAVFDAGRMGGEASSAGAGMLSPGGEFDRPSAWLELGIASMREYPAFVEELAAETSLPIDFRVCGGLHVVNGEEEWARARNRILFQSEAGIRVEQTAEGLFYPEDGLVDPNHLLRALRCACEARQVRLLENHAVGQIDADDYGAVVVAAGAWSGQVPVRHKNDLLSLP